MGKSNMVEVIRSAGGTTTPATFPKLEERPDPMLSEDPPWADQGNISYWPENGAEKLTDSKETENKLLDGKTPTTALENLKLYLSTLLTRKNKNTDQPSENNIISENSYFYKISENYKRISSTLLNRNRKEKPDKKGKSFVKVWLRDVKGQQLKLYTFRKE
jgi:hypothetical protein